MVVRLSAAAAFMADTFFATRALRRSFSSAVHFAFLTPIRSSGTRCCIWASDYREARSVQDVNLLHIPTKPSVRGSLGVGRAMADYRIYLMDTDGHIFKSVELICANDEQAMEHAQRLAVGHDVELWQLDRQVAKFPDRTKTP